MECTGERFLPEFYGDWALEHVHRYLLACELATDKVVLDIASGEGYGSAMLAEKSQQVFGVDIDAPTVERARRKYTAENLSFLQGSATSIPLDADSVDLVVSFETIEHLQDHDTMMKEIRRVLHPDGILIISSPDKYEYSDVRSFKNEFHVRELYFKEFDHLLAKYFSHHLCFGQKIAFGSVIAPREKNYFYSWQKDDTNPPVSGISHAVYHIAIASDASLPELPGGLFQAPQELSDLVGTVKGKMGLEIQGLEQRNSILEEKIRESERQMKELEGKYSFLKNEYNNNLKKLADESAMMQSLLHSKSWRITAPLRAIARLLGGK